ncbi:MAG: hypothetical protein ACM3S0_11810 [Acidobacteriota bacterium]
MNKVIRMVVTTTSVVIVSTLLLTIPNPISPVAAQGPGGITGVPVIASGSAVVNFAELARQESSRSPVSGSPRGVAVPFNSYVDPNSTFNPRVPDSPVARPQPSLASPGPSLNYMGLDDIAVSGTNNYKIPPDTMGAVGLTRVLDTLNNNYRVQDKATGATVSTLSMGAFWASTGATGPFDPKTFYDPYNNRFIVAAVSNAASPASAIAVGVSTGSDPNSSFNLFKFAACNSTFPCGGGTADWWADYPTVGFNKNWIAVAVNMFETATGTYKESRLLVFNYPQLLAGMSPSPKYFTGLTDFAVQPCVTYAGSENTLFAPVHIGGYGASYRLNTITGTPDMPLYAQGVLKFHTVASLKGGWSEPSGLTDIEPQSSGTGGSTDVAKINSGDSRILKCTFRNGNIWYSQTVGLPTLGMTHTAAQWVRLDTNGNDVDGGRVEDPTATATNGGKWYAYPTLTVNAFNEVLMGFTQFASNQWPSAGYVFRYGYDTAGTMRDPYIYKSGEGMYWKTFACPGGSNRWGDYSATMVDPVDGLTMWTLQQYSRSEGALSGAGFPGTGCNSGVWSTWWARVGTPRTLSFFPLIAK